MLLSVCRKLVKPWRRIMGVAASPGLSLACLAAPESDLKATIRSLSDESRAKLVAALWNLDLRVHGQPPAVMTATCVCDQKADLGEGPLWDRRRDRLLWIDVLGAKLYEFDPVSKSNRVMDLSMHTANVTTVVPCQNSKSLVVVGVSEGFALYDLDTGDFKPHPSNPVHRLNEQQPAYKAGEPELGGETMARMNDGRCDPTGRLWCGSLVRDGKRDIIMGAGALYTLDSWDADVKFAMGNISVSNGMAWHEGTMYYTDSPSFGVDAMSWSPDSSPSSIVSSRRQAFKVAESFPPVPDGCALDSEGKLWITLFGAGAVKRIDPVTREVLAVVKLPEEAGLESTACAFGGPGQTELYIATAREYWEEDDERNKKHPKAGGLFKVSSEQLGGITGVPAYFFAYNDKN
mmetsp:Transcript_72703/g.134249  ORF Transcript_72703/g.134249 Transcript_72703/m.134249 type:complete len:404 (+) Transcript_72703:57-1268(+)